MNVVSMLRSSSVHPMDLSLTLFIFDLVVLGTQSNSIVLEIHIDNANMDHDTSFEFATGPWLCDRRSEDGGDVVIHLIT